MHITMKKYNTYNLNNEYGIGYTRKGLPFYFDKSDYALIKEYCWCSNKGYIMTHSKDGMLQMHRLVLNLDTKDKRILVDHINHDTRDNRKQNLRICTQSLNSMNNSKAQGICFDKSRNKWLASIKINGKSKYLGRYSNKDEALKARRLAEEQYFKEYSYNNSRKLSSKIQI